MFKFSLRLIASLRLFTAASLLFALCLGHAAENAYTIAVIPKGTTHEFWKSINAGAVKAQRELADKGTKVEVIWKGPLREDDRDQQIQVVENFMARHVSAIVLAPLDSQAMGRQIGRASCRERVLFS